MTPSIYTLINPTVAKPGYSFEFLGVAEPCTSCRNLKVCLGKLQNGEFYSVTEVGKNKLDCPLIEGKAVVVQVKPSPRLLAVSRGQAVEGMTVTVTANAGDGLPCGEECRCLPRYVKAGQRYVVKRIVKKSFDCPYSSSRSLVEVTPA